MIKVEDNTPVGGHLGSQIVDNSNDQNRIQTNNEYDLNIVNPAGSQVSGPLVVESEPYVDNLNN